LRLSPRERERIAHVERAARSAHPDRFAQLTGIAEDTAANRRYEELSARHPEMAEQEWAWLTAAIREALAEPEPGAPWALLYLTMASRAMVAARIEHRLNPRPVAMPSAFVYAMQ
jgi:hypothetical protein